MEKLNEIIREVFNTSQESFEDGLAFTDLENWDSLTHMLFITQLEGELSIELTGDEIAEMMTIGDLRNVVGKHTTLQP